MFHDLFYLSDNRDLPNVKDTENTSIPILLIDTTGCDLNELDIADEFSKGNEGKSIRCLS